MARRIERRFDDAGNLIEEIYDGDKKTGSSITKYDTGGFAATKSSFDERGQHISTTKIWWDYETDREVLHSTPSGRLDRPAGHWRTIVIQKGIRDDYRKVFVPAYKRPAPPSSRLDIKKTQERTVAILPVLIGLGVALYHMPSLSLWRNWSFMTTLEWAYAGPIGLLIGSALVFCIDLMTGTFKSRALGNLMVFALFVGILPPVFTIVGWVILGLSYGLGLNSFGIQVTILVFYSVMLLIFGAVHRNMYEDGKLGL